MQRRRQPHGTIELHQMTCAIDQFNLSTRNELCQSMSPVNRDPAVVVAPDYEYGQIEVWVEAFEAPQVLGRSYTGCGSRLRAA